MERRYADKTFENLMTDLLSRVPDTIDKREGSLIYDALSPTAKELEQAYIELDKDIALGFADTSKEEYLELRTTEMGIDRQPAIYASRKGFFYGPNDVLMDVPVGSRFMAEEVNYVAVERISLGQYALQCEESGDTGNRPLGELVAITTVAGLARAELGEIITEGEDAESDASLRERYHFRVRQPITSGNIYHYKQWAREVAGVGDAKVFPLWNGNGTVKVAIANSDIQPASPGLVSDVAEYIESVRPIGATMTVVSAIGKPINVNVTVVLAAGYGLQVIYDAFLTGVQEYLQGIAFSSTYVSHARIGTLLLTIPGVNDYSNLLLNDALANVTLGSEEIPITGSIDLEV
ncbi:baseplate J/gp47 family protein [Sporomusa sp.]|uniref:baseplate J/gp47 family protein n=1 Tax=Sporomusa sp. TaxID=2078658 RepID=UPI002CABD6F5|nr:baseplate J/gp47 family protein [Sporomusa sp.]HWR07092.1 baseplate J/gp47 family protein [Sporomusa sp.]